MCDQIDFWSLPDQILVSIRTLTLPLALIFNPLCIVLLVYKAKILLRSYKHLLICICLLDALFSVLYFLAGPTPKIENSSIYVLNCGFFAQDPILNRFLLHALFCLLAVSGYTLTILFIYRCTHICKSHYLYIFQSRWFWIFVSIGFAVMISLAEIVASALSGELNLPNPARNHSSNFAYIVIRPYDQDFENTNLFSARFAIYLCFFGLFFSALVIVYCSCRILYDIRNVPMGEKSRSVQIHLFKALIIQSSVPILCCYIPFILVLLSAHFIVGLHKVAAISLLFSAWYPILDPLLVIYFVVDYRRVIRGCLARLTTITKSRVRVRAATYTENSF